MYEESSNLEDMLNNPFKNLSAAKTAARKVQPPDKISPRAAAGVERPMERPVERPPVRVEERVEERKTEEVDARAERNHPAELRLLNLEKDQIIAAKRMDDLKRIIEQQNERIQLLEEELEIIRNALGKEGA